MGVLEYSILAGFLILVQVAMLGFICAPFFLQTDAFRARYFNPTNWFSGFYLLWFIIPQVYLLTGSHFMHGFDRISSAGRLEVAVKAQLLLLLFLFSIWCGCLPFAIRLRHMRGLAISIIDYHRAHSWPSTLYSLILLMAGIVANKMLGDQYMASGESRSQLVKSTGGIMLTIVGFAGAYGFASLFSRALIAKRFLLAIILLVAFALPVFMTGARARFLFPFVIALIYSMTQQESIAWGKIIAGFIFCAAVILFSDNVLSNYRNSGRLEFSTVELTETFERRNFDGFANFALISDQYRSFKPGVFLTGARDEWMESFFPSTYSRGVGFGASLPGFAWIGGRLIGLIAVGLAFGVTLGCLDTLLRSIVSPYLYWAYLFAMPWHCAISGNYIESMGKMLAAITPALIPYVCSLFVHRRDY